MRKDDYVIEVGGDQCVVDPGIHGCRFKILIRGDDNSAELDFQGGSGVGLREEHLVKMMDMLSQALCLMRDRRAGRA